MDEVVMRAVGRAIECMQQNLGEPLTIDDMARSARFSKFHFTRIFQRVTGVSPGRFLSAMRLEEAKRLLVSTSMTVADISHQVGYNSVGTFSSRFRTSVGVSPTTYRQLGGAAPTDDVCADMPCNGGPKSSVRGHILPPASGQVGQVFVGLFPNRIPQGPPVRYTVLPAPGHYVLPDVPLGTWHLIAHSISRGNGNTPHVGCHGPIAIRSEIVARLADLRLRPMNAFDPPVLLALLDFDGRAAALHEARSAA